MANVIRKLFGSYFLISRRDALRKVATIKVNDFLWTAIHLIPFSAILFFDARRLITTVFLWVCKIPCNLKNFFFVKTQTDGSRTKTQPVGFALTNRLNWVWKRNDREKSEREIFRCEWTCNPWRHRLEDFLRARALWNERESEGRRS